MRYYFVETVGLLTHVSKKKIGIKFDCFTWYAVTDPVLRRKTECVCLYF